MRLVIFFDLPTIKYSERKDYRKFVKYLTNEGYIRVQYSIYCKLCINAQSAMGAKNKVTVNAPSNGDIRLLIISEQQYLQIISLNNTYSFQEKITNMDRLTIIGGFDDT